MKKPVSDHGFFIARYKRPFTPALSLQEKEPTEVSGVFHRPESASRLWIQRQSFKSVNFCNIPRSVPSPMGEG
jgi:hypothetical protein